MKHRILLVCNENAHFTEFYKLLRSSLRERFEFILLFDRDSYDATSVFTQEIEVTRAAGVQALILPASYSSSPFAIWLYDFSERVFRYRWLQKLKIEISTSRFVFQMGKFFDARTRWKEKLERVSEILRNNNIRVIIMGEENFLLRTYLYTRPAKGTVPIIVYPYTVPNPKEMALGACFSCPLMSWTGLLLRACGGRWVKVFDGQVVLLMNLIEAIMLFPYWPKRPWILNDGDHDFLCIESPHMLELYRRLGFDERLLRLTGSVNDDELVHKKIKNHSGRPRIVIALPPNQFDSPRAEFQEYSQFLEAILEIIAPWSQDYEFVFTKHPRLNSDFDQVLRDHNLSSLKAIELLPGAALYIASVSATIRWAIASGVPCINYDIWRYDYGDFGGVGGVITTFSIGQTADVLNRLLRNNGTELEKLQAVQIDCAKDWGFTDGRSVERLRAVFEEALNREAPD